MKQSPFIITPKDLLYFDDILNHTAVFLKKLKCYKSLVNNKQVGELLNSVEGTLLSHYDELLSILEG